MLLSIRRHGADCGRLSGYRNGAFPQALCIGGNHEDFRPGIQRPVATLSRLEDRHLFDRHAHCLHPLLWLRVWRKRRRRGQPAAGRSHRSRLERPAQRGADCHAGAIGHCAAQVASRFDQDGSKQTGGRREAGRGGHHPRRLLGRGAGRRRRHIDRDFEQRHRRRADGATGASNHFHTAGRRSASGPLEHRDVCGRGRLPGRAGAAGLSGRSPRFGPRWMGRAGAYRCRGKGCRRRSQRKTSLPLETTSSRIRRRA